MASAIAFLAFFEGPNGFSFADNRALITGATSASMDCSISASVSTFGLPDANGKRGFASTFCKAEGIANAPVTSKLVLSQSRRLMFVAMDVSVWLNVKCKKILSNLLPFTSSIEMFYTEISFGVDIIFRIRLN